MFTPSIFFSTCVIFCCVMALPGIFLAWPFFQFESCQVRIIDTSAEHLGTCFFPNSKRRPWRPRQSWKEMNRIESSNPSMKAAATPWKFNIAPEKWCLENYCPIGKVTFSGAMLNFGRVAVSFREGIFECLRQIWGRYQRVLHQMSEMFHLKLPVEVGSLPMVVVIPHTWHGFIHVDRYVYCILWKSNHQFQ